MVTRNMGYQAGIAREQTSLFPPRIEELIPGEHMVRVIDAYVDGLDLRQLKFERAVPADTGRPGFDPREMLKLYLYGYWRRLRSSRVLEGECERNVELMWLLRELRPDFRSIAKFRSDNRQALQSACAGYVEFLREAKLIGEGALTVAVDGSKFKASAARDSVMDAEQLGKARARVDKAIAGYLHELDEADARESGAVEPSREAIEAALARLRARAGCLQQAQERLKDSPAQGAGAGRVSLTDADALRLRTSGGGYTVGYNVQQAVEAQHKLIIAHEVTPQPNDQQSLLPGAQMAHSALGKPKALTLLADTGYMNGEQTKQCEALGISAVVPMQQASHTRGVELYAKSEFHYDAETNTYRCPAGQLLRRIKHDKKCQTDTYATSACGHCAHKSACTSAKQRTIARNWHAAYAEAAHQRAKDAPQLMRLRSAVVEHPFGTLKAMMPGGFLLRTLAKVKGEMALAVLTYNLKRVFNILGFAQMMQLLRAR